MKAIEQYFVAICNPYFLFASLLLYPDYPVFTVVPSNTTVDAGNSATLSCRAHGPDKPHITWMIEDSSGMETNIVPSADIQVQPSGDLTYTSVESKNRGLHICKACNTAGCKRVKAFLDVLCEYPVFHCVQVLLIFTALFNEM